MPGKVVECPLLEIFRKYLAMVPVNWLCWIREMGHAISRGHFQSQPLCASVIPIWMPLSMTPMDADYIEGDETQFMNAKFLSKVMVNSLHTRSRCLQVVWENLGKQKFYFLGEKNSTKIKFLVREAVTCHFNSFHSEDSQRLQKY